MKVQVLIDGPTFGGKVWLAGDIIQDHLAIPEFPSHRLEPSYRDGLGRQWFRILDDAPANETEGGDIDPNATGTSGADDQDLACQFCGKPYKRQNALENHEAQCTENPANKDGGADNA